MHFFLKIYHAHCSNPVQAELCIYMEWMTLILDILFFIESMFTHNIIWFGLNRPEGDWMRHTQEQHILCAKNLISNVFFGPLLKEKRGSWTPQFHDLYNWLSLWPGGALAVPNPPGGDNQYKPHHHHFPHEQHNSMGPEMGMHLLLGEPPFLWKLPLSCFKHLSINVFLTAYVCEDGG